MAVANSSLVREPFAPPMMAKRFFASAGERERRGKDEEKRLVKGFSPSHPIIEKERYQLDSKLLNRILKHDSLENGERILFIQYPFFFQSLSPPQSLPFKLTKCVPTSTKRSAEDGKHDMANTRGKQDCFLLCGDIYLGKKRTS